MNKIFLTTRMAKGRNMKRRTHRKGTRRNNSRRMRGGYVLTGSDINDTSMNAPNKLNMLQGQEYASLHANQHGGVAPVGNTGVLPQDMRHAARVDQAGGMAPVGDTGVMDVGRVEARLGPLDASFQEIAGMKDQAGGRRRRRTGCKSRRSGRKSRRSGRKSRRSARRSTRRYMRGGVASVNDSTTLLPVSMEKQAVMEMNPEWKLAENPTSFNPTR
jgi:hypothetical protein